ncbi:MAG TPA: IPT/TIG domain-containing protein [Acidimicrobiales bacterium]|jgi:hypothetical protein|nr:IPT/TIG domain-containing protein [Acidimicrobiales bacterium]
MRLRTVTSILLAAFVVLGAAGTSSGANPPTILKLTLPEAQAFAILGHDCGGIVRQSIATGFDVTSGFPTADVFMKTTCSAGGKGGHSVTYTAYATAEWDFTGALVSDAALAGAPSPDPTATATDGNGNQTYSTATPSTCATLNWTSCTYAAYLARAATFVPVPRVTGLSVTVGAAAGGESVTISGTGFTGATGVAFGARSAASFTVVGDTSITAIVPAIQPGPAKVSVTSPGGTSLSAPGDVITFYDVPQVTNVSPRAGPAGGVSTVTITGAHLAGATSIDAAGVPIGFTPVNDTTISATVPPTDEADIVQLTVISPGGTSAVGTADRFVYAPTSCTSATPCESSAHCAKLSGSVRGSLTLSACSPRSSRYAHARFTLAGATLTWSSSAKTTSAFLGSPTAMGRGGCAAGHTEEDLYGVVDGGSATIATFGDAIHARLCVSPSGRAVLVPHTTFHL